MIETIAEEIEQFRAALRLCLGLEFDDSRTALLGKVLQRRLRQLKETPESYLCRLRTRPGSAECATLARELTVGETYFFRNHEQFRALTEIALPQLMQANAASRKLRLLSAGCASGEEAYSLAIAARAAVLNRHWEIEVLAVDINPAALAKAERARYSAWALRGSDAAVADRYFSAAGREFMLDEAVKAAVRFEQRNLAVEDAELWRPEVFDVVFCRNVIMYFAPEPKRALIARIAGALRPGGYLFLGSAETLRGLSEEFALQHTHATFYYRKKAAAGPRLCAPSPVGTDHWITVIRDSAERVAMLTDQPEMASAQQPIPAPADFSGVISLLRQERFAEALTLLRSLGPSPAQAAEALLLEAVLLVHSRQLPAAETACRRLLDIDAQSAGAHYVYALCRESAGDDAAAAEHDLIAANVDPRFAMPRLHLGLLRRRAGDRVGAQNELAQAHALLQGEDEARLVLFGGGFKRQNWLDLCAAALLDLGGQR